MIENKNREIRNSHSRMGELMFTLFCLLYFPSAPYNLVLNKFYCHALEAQPCLFTSTTSYFYNTGQWNGGSSGGWLNLWNGDCEFDTQLKPTLNQSILYLQFFSHIRFWNLAKQDIASKWPVFKEALIKTRPINSNYQWRFSYEDCISAWGTSNRSAMKIIPYIFIIGTRIVLF